MKLTPEQIEAVVAWMEEWEMLAGTEVPKSFREDFSKIQPPDRDLFSQEQPLNFGKVSMSADINNATIQYTTVWQPTPRLQFKSSLSQIREDAVIEVKTLQQLFVDSQGNEEWRNVEVVD